MKAMLASEISPYTKKMKALLSDIHWMCEPKYDGIRTLIHVTESGTRWQNRNDEPLLKPKPGDVDLALGGLPPGIVFDGEIVGQHLYVFDLPHFGTSLANTSWYRRRKVLEEVIDVIGASDHLRLSEVARTTEEKSEFLRRATYQHWEGIMLKHIHGLYLPGARSAKMVKVKFTKQADCIVMEVGADGKESATLGVWDHAEMVEIGRCSLAGKEKVEVGDVVEVRYLYSNNQRLVQPRLVRKRMDKHTRLCTIQQFKNAHAVAEPQ